MQHAAAISGTYCGSNGACAAVMSTMQFYSEHDVRGHIWRIGSRLKGGMNALGHPLQLQGMPPRMRMTWHGKGDDWPHLSIVVEQLADRGIHVACGGVLPSYAHTEADADAFIAAVDEACGAIAAGATLRGLPIEPAFQRDPGAR
jgi:glutamate-1-semialdehyde aminotransferase